MTAASSPTPPSVDSSALRLTHLLGDHRETYLHLALAASSPYWRFLFGDEARAVPLRRSLLDLGAIEICPPAGKLLMRGDRPVGMIACMPATTVADYRTSGGQALATGPWLTAEPDLARRLGLAATTLLRLREDDFYLSRIAVAPALRRRGLGDFLMSRVIDEARASRGARCVLEVEQRNTGAQAMYRRYGFTIIDERRAEDPETKRSLAYVHMARPIA